MTEISVANEELSSKYSIFKENLQRPLLIYAQALPNHCLPCVPCSCQLFARFLLTVCIVWPFSHFCSTWLLFYAILLFRKSKSFAL
jgi:hypothetical protein